MDRDWDRDEYPECLQQFCGTMYKNQKKLDELCDYFRSVEKLLT